MNKPLPGIRKSSNPLVFLKKSDETVDVESEPEIPTVIYDIENGKNMMMECQRYALNAKPDRNEEDWEDKISR